VIGGEISDWELKDCQVNLVPECREERIVALFEWSGFMIGDVLIVRDARKKRAGMKWRAGKKEQGAMRSLRAYFWR
jgi:hypothetical protein